MKSPFSHFIANATKASRAELDGNTDDILTDIGYNELARGKREQGARLLELLKKKKEREQLNSNRCITHATHQEMHGFSTSDYFLHLRPANKPPDALSSFAMLSGSSEYTDFHPYLISAQEKTPPAKPTLSLLSSVFNCPSFLEKCLRNVTQQTIFSESQVLLFDASTNDESYYVALPFLMEHHNIVYFKLRNDIGLYSIWNLGLAISDARYIGNLNTDDLRHPLHGSALVEFLDVNKDVDIASTTIIPWNDEDSEIMESTSYDLIKETSLMTRPEPWYTHLEGIYSIDSLFLKSQEGTATSSQCIPHCAPIWRKSMHLNAGYFNEHMFYSAADWGLWLTALSLGSKAAVINKAYTYYYVNQSSYMRRDAKAEGLINAFCDSYEQSTLSATLRNNTLKDICVPNDIIEFAVNLRSGH